MDITNIAFADNTVLFIKDSVTLVKLYVEPKNHYHKVCENILTFNSLDGNFSIEYEDNLITINHDEGYAGGTVICINDFGKVFFNEIKTKLLNNVYAYWEEKLSQYK